MHMVHWYLVHTSLKCVDTHHNKASTSTLRIQSRFQHFNPLLGTSDSPANCKLCVAKYEDGRVHNLVDTLKRSEPL